MEYSTMMGLFKKLGTLFTRAAAIQETPKAKTLEIPLEVMRCMTAHIKSERICKDPNLTAEQWRTLGNIINKAPRTPANCETYYIIAERFYEISRQISRCYESQNITLKEDTLDFLNNNKDIIRDIATTYRNKQEDFSNVYRFVPKSGKAIPEDLLPFNYNMRTGRDLDLFVGKFESIFIPVSPSARPVPAVGMPRGSMSRRLTKEL